MRTPERGGSMGAMTMADMVDALKGKTGDAMDQAFLATMIPHHAGGVAMARETLATGAHPELKRLCQHIITDQTAEIAQMRGWQKAWGFTVSPAMLANSRNGRAISLAVNTPAPERAAGRRALAAKGQALPGGQEPIPDLDYLKRAIRSVGRLDPAKRPALKALIIKRARELKATNASGVKGTWAFQGSNDSGALEFVGPHGYIHGWIKVGGSPLTKDHGLKPGDMIKGSLPVHGNVNGVVTHITQRGDIVASINAHGHVIPHATFSPESITAHKPKTTLAEAQRHIGLKATSHANDTEAIGLAGYGGRLPLVRGAADVQMRRTGPGAVTVQHKSTGMKVGTVIPAASGYQGVHADGTKTPASGSMGGAMAGLIAYHNKRAGKLPPAQQDGTAVMAGSAKTYAGDQETLDLAGALPTYSPASSSTDGPRITTMGGAGKAKAVPPLKLKMADQDMDAAWKQVYRKLIAKGLKPAQAMAMAKRAAAMHAKAAA